MNEKIYTIKKGAIFIADAHLNANRREFALFLNKIKTGEIRTLQLFFLGDMFDFLSNFAHYSHKFYENEIALINEISRHTEIFYFEGNHDYNLSEIFPNVRVFSVKTQPVKFVSEMAQSVEISHGDKFGGFFKFTILLPLRMKFVLKVLNFIDKSINFALSKKIFAKLARKNLSYKIANFRSVIAPKIVNYSANLIIEGHYHQGKNLKFNEKYYINLSSFACDKRIFIVEYDQNNKIRLRGHNV